MTIHLGQLRLRPALATTGPTAFSLSLLPVGAIPAAGVVHHLVPRWDALAREWVVGWIRED